MALIRSCFFDLFRSQSQSNAINVRTNVFKQHQILWETRPLSFLIWMELGVNKFLCLCFTFLWSRFYWTIKLTGDNYVIFKPRDEDREIERIRCVTSVKCDIPCKDDSSTRFFVNFFFKIVLFFFCCSHLCWETRKNYMSAMCHYYENRNLSRPVHT